MQIVYLIFILFKSPGSNVAPPTFGSHDLMFSELVARGVCCKSVIVQTSNNFRTCTQKRSHCVLLCHSGGSDFMLPPPRKHVFLITAHHKNSDEAIFQPAIRRWAWSIHTIEKRCGDIPKQFHSCSNFGH